MKSIFLNAFAVICALLLLPIAAMQKDDKTQGKAGLSAVAAEKTDIEYEDTPTDSDIFRILIKDTDEVAELSAKDYIVGVVAAEMPALYHEEALKAQAVAAYTYACRKREAADDKEYDLTDDPDTDQCYINETAMREKWGDSADEYIKKITVAVEAVSGLYLSYDGTPALTVYHAVSGGKTESCKDVWGSSLPYLVPVDSLGDRLEENYLTTVSHSPDKLSELLSSLCDTSGDSSEWFSETDTTESGRVKSVKVCGTELTGAQIADALSLPSANFSVTYKDAAFTFEVRGRGHGVGMSQYGADYMAKQGSSFEEILKHYYTGCELKENK